MEDKSELLWLAMSALLPSIVSNKKDSVLVIIKQIKIPKK